MQPLACLLIALLVLHAAPALAWWNGDWSGRVKITFDGAAAGLRSGVAQLPVLVRLHTGNFAFAEAKPDGSDLRFVADDDRTPLRHHVERYDSTNELAFVWVLVPGIASGGNTSFWLYHGNPKAPAADDPRGSYDPSYLAVLHFSENEGLARDATAYGNNAGTVPARRNPASLIGGGLLFSGNDTLVVPASGSLAFTGANGVTLSAWVKPAGAQSNATLFALREGGRGLTVTINGGALAAQAEGGRAAVRVTGGRPLSPDTWHHVAVTAGKRLVLYLDGAEIGAADGELPDMKPELLVGRGYVGELDALVVAGAVRSADAILAAAKSQGPDSPVVALGEGEASAGATASYVGVLFAALTVDGWVVVVICFFMLLISLWVMVSKTLAVSRTERDNRRFLDTFRAADPNSRSALLEVAPNSGALPHSSLWRMYLTGTEQIRNRVGDDASGSLSMESMTAIRASIDATLVRENQKLNSLMVLLTISISGGPFLGLLGTVIGVMITFAAIAATGDVNVAAIAPGIAAALIATVAGLGVAIPALFGYNYIGSRIKNISADMQVFADEFIARAAESFAPRGVR